MTTVVSALFQSANRFVRTQCTTPACLIGGVRGGMGWKTALMVLSLSCTRRYAPHVHSSD